jgi:phage-related protein
MPAAARTNRAPTARPPAATPRAPAVLGAIPTAGGAAVRLSPVQASAAGPVPQAVRDLVQAAGPGQPLLPELQQKLENSLSVPLYPVRVHADARTGEAVDALGIRAFTFGLHVYLGSHELPTDLDLMAHEVAHVVQQQGQPVYQTFTSRSTADPLEREAQTAASAASQGQQSNVQGRTGGAQAQGFWPVDQIVGWLEDRAMDLLRRYAPELEEIIRLGPIEWIKQKIIGAVQTVIDVIMSPIRAVQGAIRFLTGSFAELLAWIQDAAARIARGDCSALTEAAEKIQKALEGVISPIVDKLQSVASRIKGFFVGIWERFGAPVLEFLENAAGWVWQKMKDLANWIWDKTEPIRNILGRAWRWIKRKLGIGDDTEGSGGVWGWVKEKAAGIWNDYIKPFLERFKRPLMVVAGILLLLSPAGPVILFAGAVAGIMVGIRWIRQHMRSRDAVVQQRGYLRGVIFPAIMGAVNRVTTALQNIANSILSKLNGIIGGLGDAIGAVAGTILSFAATILRWVADRIGDILNWVIGAVQGFVNWVGQAFARLMAWLQPVFDFLGKLIGVVTDILKLPFLILGALWRLIPACIRNPVVDFLINQILKRIPIVRNLVALAEVWPRIQARAMGIIRKIFVDGDLAGAIMDIFRALLEILNVPVELVVSIFDKAGSAIDLIVDNPIQFLKNFLRAIWQGFKLFFEGFVRNVLLAIAGWLFGQLGSLGITMPTDLSFRSIFKLVVQILGITVDHIFRLLADRVGPERAAQIRRVYNTLAGAWEWVKVAITEGVPGVWRMLQEKINDLWETVRDTAIGWLTTNIIRRATAQLLTMLDPTGIMAVVNAILAIYAAIKTAVEYLRQILEMVNKVLDGIISLARGVIAPAAGVFKDALIGALSVAIGFLANYLRLGGIAQQIRDAIVALREKVDVALRWIIDKAVSAVEAIVGAVRSAAAAIAEWWRMRKKFRQGGEEHTLYFEGDANSAQLMIKSASKPLPEYIAELRARQPAVDASIITTVESEVAKIQAIKTRTGGGFGQNAGEEIRVSLDTIAEKLAQAGLVTLPRTVVTLGPTPVYGGEVGWKMTAFPLSINPPAEGGSAPYEESRLWLGVNVRRMAYIRGHLLNHHLFGPGKNENLVPIARDLNSQMSTAVEEPLKQKVLQERKIARYEVAVNFPASPRTDRVVPAENFLPRNLTIKAEIVEPKGAAWDGNVNVTETLYNSSMPHTLPPNTPVSSHGELVRLAINNPVSGAYDAIRAYGELPGIGGARALAMLNERNAGGPFRSWQDVINRVDGVTADLAADWQSLRGPDPADPQGLRMIRKVYLDGDTVWR